MVAFAELTTTEINTMVAIVTTCFSAVLVAVSLWAGMFFSYTTEQLGKGLSSVFYAVGILAVTLVMIDVARAVGAHDKVVTSILIIRCLAIMWCTASALRFVVYIKTYRLPHKTVIK